MRRGNVTLGTCQKIWDGYFSNLNVQTKMQVQGQTVLCGYEDASRLNMEEFFSGRRIWNVNKGALHVIMHGQAGKTMVLFKITPDNAGFVLPDGCLDIMVHNIEIISVGQTELCYLPECLSKQMYSECISVKNWQAQQYLKIFSKLLDVINDLSFLSLYERLLKTLYEYCRLNHTDTIRVTHEMLADEMATSREVISRLLKKMAAEGIIAIERKNIRILNLNGPEMNRERKVG